jgi:hypothetical protein
LQKFQTTRLCTKKTETWCVSFLCATAKEKNIKKIFEKKRKIPKKTTRAKIRKKEKKRKKSST